MAIWNDFGKKATETTSKAVQQAKARTEIFRLNGLIADENKAIEDTYLKIGKIYVSIHRDDYEENFAWAMNAIKESEKKIEEYKAQIQQAKGVQICSGCGAEVSVESAFCSVCGTPMPKKPVVVADNVCTNCGAVLAEGMRFCTTCGTPRVEKAAEPVAQPVQEPVVVQKRLCANCGAELGEEMLFCMECGAKA